MPDPEIREIIARLVVQAERYDQAIESIQLGHPIDQDWLGMASNSPVGVTPCQFDPEAGHHEIRHQKAQMTKIWVFLFYASLAKIIVGGAVTPASAMPAFNSSRLKNA